MALLLASRASTQVPGPTLFRFGAVGPGMFVDGELTRVTYVGAPDRGADGRGSTAVCGPVMRRGTGTFSVDFIVQSGDSRRPFDPGTRVGLVSGADVDLRQTLGRSGFSWGYAADGDVFHNGDWVNGRPFLERFHDGDQVGTRRA